ncbi:MAG: dienelactone hydrolase family protein [Gemmatimonadetes bacterium]|nr:dienelactone hydrolase family protein [Gemmatimonadota bacterium]
MRGEWITLQVDDGTEMRAWVEWPVGEGTHAGILVLQDAYGVGEHIRDVAGRFAAEGYTALAPELFHRTAPGFEGTPDQLQDAMDHIRAMTVDGQAADLEAAQTWLAGQPSVDEGRTAAVGFCMGGRAAFLANAVTPLAASISYYGGGIAEGLLDRAPQLSGPQLLFWAGQDARILPEHVRAVEDALRAAEKRYASVVFSQAQHSFFNEPMGRYDPDAARQSWALALQFLRSYVLER